MFLTTNNTDTSNLEQAVNVSETKVVNSDIVFIVDSGATCHLINKQYKKFLINIKPVSNLLMLPSQEYQLKQNVKEIYSYIHNMAESF